MSPSAVSPSAGQAAGSSAPAERPQAATSGNNARRNKRRRHGRNPGGENVRPLAPVGQREAPQQDQADSRKP
ncbi:hypothetical protein, partial [Shinella sp.]|uniref:hypothetical protein n=1 Tax=Shinella sp. TaxID=1870904 RepID=UPI0039E3BE5D